jgi:hypothetical protein
MRVAPGEAAPRARRGKATQRRAERAALEGVKKVPNRENVKSPSCNDEACSRDSSGRLSGRVLTIAPTGP